MEILENEKNMTIIENDGSLYLFSYNSKIAIYRKNCEWLDIGKLWNYSQTTLKHFKHFINTHTNYTYESKQAFQKQIKENYKISTGNW